MTTVEVVQPPQPADLRLGRLIEFDRRSLAYPAVEPAMLTLSPRSYTWACTPTFNQGGVGACVGYSIVHELAARPVVVRSVSETTALGLYAEAQKLDPWPGEDYEGTSVLAGMKAATARGYYSEFRWAFGIDDLIICLGYKGPAVLGINWYSGLFTPDLSGIVRPTGAHMGGHAILANGIRCVFRGGVRSLESLDRELTMVRLHNSWGTGWGLRGECFISVADLAVLLGQAGEACIPVRRTGLLSRLIGRLTT